MAHDWPIEFSLLALPWLESAEDRELYRFVARLLLLAASWPVILDLFMHPQRWPRDRAASVFKKFFAVDPLFDLKFGKRLIERIEDRSDRISPASVQHAMELLHAISEGPRLLRILSPLADSANAKIAAKAALFIGKRCQNCGWAERQLQRDNPRIRANTVESLWGLREPWAEDSLTNMPTTNPAVSRAMHWSDFTSSAVVAYRNGS